MLLGVFCGLSAAILNSIGYIFSARFLLRYDSALRLVVAASLVMMFLCLPFLPFLFPWAQLQDRGEFLTMLVIWVTAFWCGQGCFFMCLKYFNASCLSSFLGLKIVVLALIFLFFKHQNPGMWQWIAVFLSAGAAVSFNWTGAEIGRPAGWLFLFITLLCYSTCDIYETQMILRIMECGCSLTRASLTATAVVYSALGVVSLPFLFFLKMTKKQLVYAAPYAVLWLGSQVMLFACFALLLPVFGNVILATRGIFSVLVGAVLAAFGLSRFDSQISRSQWIKRGFAACAMTAAIAIYSFAQAGILK